MARSLDATLVSCTAPLIVSVPAMLVRLGLLALAATQFALAAWMIFDPGSFHTQLGDFGARNDHYLRDIATWELAFGLAALVAVARPSWRLPVLTIAAVQFILHTINHIADADLARGDTSGVQDAVSLGVGAVVFTALAWLAAREARVPA